jgi:hypothetical protein
VFEQKREDLEGLLLEAQLAAVLAQLARAEIELEDSKARDSAVVLRHRDGRRGSVALGRGCGGRGGGWQKAVELRSADPSTSLRASSQECPSPHVLVPTRWRYNVLVPSTERPGEQHDESDHKHQRHAIYATETAGLLLIAFLLLALTLVRYWHAIHWSLR